MNTEPLVSVIIPCYNHGAYISDCIDSVLNQSYQNIEIIIVDDGSTNESTLIVLKGIGHPLVQIIYQEHTGPGTARNNAMKIARGKYIVFLDSDDLIRKDTIDTCVRILEEKPETAVVYGNCRYFGDGKKLRKQEPFNHIQLLNDNTMALCSVIRTEAFLSTEGFDGYLSLKGLEDWDLWLMIHEKGWGFEYVNEIHFDVRILKTSRTNQVANRNLKEIKAYIYKKHSALLSREFVALYHDNKNLKGLIDYKIGNMLLKPFRWVKKKITKFEQPHTMGKH